MHLLIEHSWFYWKYKCLRPNAALLLEISGHYFYLYTVPSRCLFTMKHIGMGRQGLVDV